MILNNYCVQIGLFIEKENLPGNNLKVIQKSFYLYLKSTVPNLLVPLVIVYELKLH